EPRGPFMRQERSVLVALLATLAMVSDSGCERTRDADAAPDREVLSGHRGASTSDAVPDVATAPTCDPSTLDANNNGCLPPDSKCAYACTAAGEMCCALPGSPKHLGDCVTSCLANPLGE